MSQKIQNDILFMNFEVGLQGVLALLLTRANCDEYDGTAKSHASLGIICPFLLPVVACINV